MSAHTTEKAERLEPCPFCQSVEVEVQYDGSGDYETMCRKCLSCGPFGRSHNGAIAAWNRRAQQVAREDVVSLPLSADQAETMLRAAMMYLNEHAPERLAQPVAAPVLTDEQKSLLEAMAKVLEGHGYEGSSKDIRSIIAAMQRGEGEKT